MNRGDSKQIAFGTPDTVPPIIEIYSMETKIGLPTGHEPHQHEKTIEICFIARGYLHWWLEDQTFDIHAGDIIIMMPNQAHGSLDSTLQPCEYFAVHIDPLLLSSEIQAAIAEIPISGHYSAIPEAGEIVRQLFREHVEKLPLRAESCRSLITLLITLLVRYRTQKVDLVSDSYLISRAKRLVANAEPGTITVSTLSERLRISVVWLTKVFKQELGQTPGDWLRSMQIETAKQLLLNSELTVSDIAFKTGFASSQYFATAFRRETGWTPSDYRRPSAGHTKETVLVAPD